MSVPVSSVPSASQRKSGTQCIWLAQLLTQGPWCVCYSNWFGATESKFALAVAEPSVAITASTMAALNEPLALQLTNM